MILIGQYDSPFVRRVAIALTLYELPFEHRPWSGFGDADLIAEVNPLIRVPTLVMDDGFVLMDSAAILDVVDDLVGPERATLRRGGADRRELLRICALAAGVADKGVSLVYENAFREAALAPWVARCRRQISGALDLLEDERAARSGPWLFGAKLSHADIIVATMWRFIKEALPGAFDLPAWAALAAHSEECEALPVFRAICQPYALAMPAEG